MMMGHTMDPQFLSVSERLYIQWKIIQIHNFRKFQLKLYTNFQSYTSSIFLWLVALPESKQMGSDELGSRESIKYLNVKPSNIKI